MPEVNSTHRQVLADFLSASYRVVGKIMVPNSGLVGMMNDTNNSFLEVLNAKLARAYTPTKLVGGYEILGVSKSNLFAVCLTRREDLGPQATARGGYQTLTNYTIRVTSQVYELEGSLEWSGRFEFASVMGKGASDFISLFNATLTSILIPQLHIESPAILFNRRQMDTLAVLAEKRKTGPIA
jgi:hypothetical protein